MSLYLLVLLTYQGNIREVRVVVNIAERARNIFLKVIPFKTKLFRRCHLDMVCSTEWLYLRNKIKLKSALITFFFVEMKYYGQFLVLSYFQVQVDS